MEQVKIFCANLSVWWLVAFFLVVMSPIALGKVPEGAPRIALLAVAAGVPIAAYTLGQLGSRPPSAPTAA